MDGKIPNQGNSGQRKNWRMRSLGRTEVRGGHMWSRGCWGWQVLCKSFFKSALKYKK